MRYIQSFSSSGATQAALNEYELGKPYVAYLQDEYRIDWNSLHKATLEETPLTFEVLSAGTIMWAQNYWQGTGTTIEYSKNGGAWTSINSADFVDIPVEAGDKVQFRGDNPTYSITAITGQGVTTWINNGWFQGTYTPFKVYGNIMSLINSTGFSACTTLESAYTFAHLFEDTYVVDADQLILPATTLTNNCYYKMFKDCVRLEDALDYGLPASTAASECYYSMFEGCTNLNAGPSMYNLRTLAYGCCAYMYCGCTSMYGLNDFLRPLTLVERCYNHMFYGCSSMDGLTCLATDISATECTNQWVEGVAASGYFYKNPNMSSWTTGVSGIPSGWEVFNEV